MAITIPLRRTPTQGMTISLLRLLCLLVAILSQNKFEYDGLRHLTKEWQSHGGAVTGSTPVIQYDWDASPKDTSSSGYDRLVGMTYPARPETGARSLGFSYGAAGSVDSALNRIIQIAEGAALATYSYMGTSRRVGVTLGNGITQTFINDGACTGLDRFGRVTDLDFTKTGATVHRYQYAYDRSGNRIRAQVTQATINGTAHDNDRSYLYRYDDLQRLVSAEMGKLLFDEQEQQYFITSDTDVALYRSLTWNLDLLGNWAGPSSSPNLIGLRRQDDTNHDGSFNVTTNIDHTTDAFNKLTAVKTNGQTVTHLSDPAGNLIFDGQHVYQYDAWNRKVEVNRVGTLTVDDFTVDGKINPTGGHQIGDLVMRFIYDGLGRLIMAQKPVTGSPPDPVYRTEHYYYDGVRRVQEIDDNATPANIADDLTQHEYVYGPDYVDEFVLESQKTVSGQQTFYVLQDANYNVMALLDENGAVVEQYQWEPYGLLAAKDTNTSGTIPHSHIGHQGLFFYRFDDTTGPPLAVDAVGLYFNINRWYDPALAQFTSRDPVETAQLVMDSVATRGQIVGADARAFDPAEYYGDGFNLFSRVGNRPTDRVDALGLDFQDDIDAAINVIKVDHAIAYATTRVAIRQIERGNQLAMAYAAAAFLWDDMVWKEGEGALYSLLLAGLGARACFAEGTAVLMADGTSMPIEEISIGDEVFCDANPAADDGPETCAVTRVFARTVDGTLDLSIESQGSLHTIRTTLEHPFYVPQEGQFVPAGLLDLGVSFQGPTGSVGILRGKRLHPQDITVYNIEVAGAHDYYVAEAGSGCWLLVHNQCHGHHTVPRQILRRLKDAGNAAYAFVRGARGRPNIWDIPEELHRLIHSGRGKGGDYNTRFIERLKQLFGEAWDKVATSDAIMTIRDELIESFGLDVWRPK